MLLFAEKPVRTLVVSDEPVKCTCGHTILYGNYLAGLGLKLFRQRCVYFSFQLGQMNVIFDKEIEIDSVENFSEVFNQEDCPLYSL